LREIKAQDNAAAHFGRMLNPWKSERRVVLVDDDPSLCAALAFAMETEGICVRTFESAEAMLADGELDPACFVIDQRLPGMTGLELVARLRERDEQAPVILITSHPSAHLRAQARSAGVEIVEKPLLEGALMEKVRSIAGRR
jgi:FixJ family two-component response regulator